MIRRTAALALLILAVGGLLSGCGPYTAAQSRMTLFQATVGGSNARG